MRNSLFYQIFFLSLFIIAGVFYGLSFYGFTFRQITINNWLLTIIISIFLLALLAFLISSRYTKPIDRISRQLNDSSSLQDKFWKSPFLPVEIKQLLTSIRKFKSDNEEIKAGYEADRKMVTSILETMSDGILITDKDGNVSTINRAVREIFGLDEKNLIGNSLVEVIRNHNVNDLWQKCVASKRQETVSFETTPQKSYVRCIASPLDPEQPGNILFLFQDLTRIRRLELIRQDFVSNVSHELRTPLASIKLLTETLQASAMDDPPAAKKFLVQMDYEIDNLTQIVEELLELSRIESGLVPLEKQWVKPSQLIRTAGERMALLAERAGLDFTFGCDEDLPNLNVDSPRLSRALVNLLHNAIKFTPSGGKVEVSAYQEKEDIVFFVKDTGVGIPPKDLERIFERFYKSDPSRSNQGTGLGLSITKHLVEIHGGKIYAESEPQIGTTIRFQIPIEQNT